MKKRVLSLLMASAMIVGLTACGSSNEPAATVSTDSGNTAATTADNSGSAAGDVAMTFTWWGNQTRNERTQAALDLYSEQNPGVTFDTQPAEWNDYWTKPVSYTHLTLPTKA